MKLNNRLNVTVGQNIAHKTERFQAPTFMKFLLFIKSNSTNIQNHLKRVVTPFTVDLLALSMVHIVKDLHNFSVCGEWSAYSNCTATCDGGLMLRWRTCGGHIEVENSTCNEFPCYKPPGSRTKFKHDFIEQILLKVPL